MSFWKKLAKGEASMADVKKGTKEVGRAIDKTVFQPIMSSAPVKTVSSATSAATNNAKDALKNFKMPSLPKPKNAQTAIQKAADKVGDVIRPAAQTVAKEVGYVVNPIAGEVAMRANQIANDPNVKKAGDAIVDKVINPITTSAPVKAVQQAAQQAANTAPQAIAEAPARAIQSIQRIARDTPAKSADNNFEFLPYWWKKAPDAIGEIVRGNFGKGFSDLGEHTAAGLAPFLNALTRNTDGTMGGGRSAGTLAEEVEEEKEKEKENTIPPKKEESMSSKIGGAVMAGADTIVNAGKAGAEWVNRATDNMVVKGFSTSYGNVATQKDLNRFREAEKRGDIAEMDRIRAEMKAKQQQQGIR